MAGVPLIVSLWSRPDKQGFLCSGLLLTGRHILTVRHAFDPWPDQDPVYVRLIDGVEGDVIAQVLQRHRDRDAAILELKTPVGPIASPDLQGSAPAQSLEGQAATLRVIDPDHFGRHSPSNYSVGSFDHGTGEYVLTPENARGHSGGVVEVQGRVVGLLSRRTPTDPLCRAVAMHLLWPWIEGVVQSMAQTRCESPDAPHAIAISPAYRALAATVRKRVCALLGHPGTTDLVPHWGVDPLADLDAHLATSEIPRQLSTLLYGLHRATAACIPAWRGRSEGQIRAIKQDCCALLSELAKLAVNPAAGETDLTAIAAAPPERLHLACQFGGTGDLVFCALADVPNLLARSDQDRGIASVNAVHLDDRVSRGVGPDLRQEVLKTLWKRLMVGDPPGRIERKDYDLLLARIQRHRARDGRRYLLTAPGPRDWCDDSDCRRLADELRLSLVLHQEGQCPHLLLDEPDLIDTVREYLELLEDL